MTSLTDLPCWKALIDHAKEMQSVHLRDLFKEAPNRFETYSIEEDGLLLDFSKNRINDVTFRLLLDLARECDLESWRNKMFAGEPINVTEDPGCPPRRP